MNIDKAIGLRSNDHDDQISIVTSTTPLQNTQPCQWQLNLPPVQANPFLSP